MARIPESEIERLKREISLERLVTSRGVALRRQGQDLVGLCPFHDDREPSLVVSPSKNLWHCLGACQAGGSVIDWVMRVEGVSFRHAAELLRRDCSFAASSAPSSSPVAPPPKQSTVKKLPTLLERTADDEALLRSVTGYYHATLLESPEALAYLASRGLESAELVEHFELGFSNRTLGYRLPAKNREEGAALRGRLQELGVIRQSGHEHFNGSLVVPIQDLEGRVVEMYGRKITAGLRPGTPLHLYLPGAHRGVWNEPALASGDGELILCEALIDAMTFWCAGLRHVTSAYGVEGLGPDHWAAFRTHGVKQIWIAYDRDEAGDRAAAKLARELEASGIGSWRVLFPKGMDANEYAQKVGPADKSLALAVRKAEWMGAGKRGVVDVPKEVATSAPPEPMQDAPTEASSAEPAESLAPNPSFAASSDVSPPESATSSEPVSEDEAVFAWEGRRWRVRGLSKNTTPSSLRVNLLVSDADGRFHVDTLELYTARQRASFTAQAALELAIDERLVKQELGQVLLELESRQERALAALAAPQTKQKTLTELEREAALSLLRDPNLLSRVSEDFAHCGVVGERENILLSYVAVTSRKLESPLAVVVQSSSAAGKSSLMEAVLRFVPEEERTQYSAMTGQSLYYLGEDDLRHKVLAVAEEEGASRASYALKLLQSEGELTIASTGKDPQTGRLVTHAYRVAGPVMLFLTTTAVEVDEELLNRCLVLTVDEGREQTRQIHAQQRRRQTLEGLREREAKKSLESLHQNAQRLLRPLWVVNPFAEALQFLDVATRTRRDHMKYLTLIASVALLHQYQREVKVLEVGGTRAEYIEVTRSDIEAATRLATEVLGRSLDELSPVTRSVLLSLERMVQERASAERVRPSEVRVTRREVREYAGLGSTQAKVHLARLEELEYVVVHRSARGQVLELLYAGEGKDGGRFVLGLTPPGAPDGDAAHGYDAERSGANAARSAPGRGGVGHESAEGRSDVSATLHEESRPLATRSASLVHPARLDSESTPVASYASKAG